MTMYAIKLTSNDMLTGAIYSVAGGATLGAGEVEVNFADFNFLSSGPVQAHKIVGGVPMLQAAVANQPWYLTADYKFPGGGPITDDIDGDGLVDIEFGEANYAELELTLKDSLDATLTGFNGDLNVSTDNGTIATDADIERGAIYDDINDGGQIIHVADNTPTNITGVTIVSGDLATPHCVEQPVNITGVFCQVMSADTPTGTDGELVYSSDGKQITWQAPGEGTPSAVVDIGEGGPFTLTADGGSTLVIAVDKDLLADSDKSDLTIEVGFGELDYTKIGNLLTWKAPRDAGGAGGSIDVGSGGAFTLASADGSTIDIFVSSGSLPAGDETDSDIIINDRKIFNLSTEVDVGSTVLALLADTVVAVANYAVGLSTITFDEGAQPRVEDDPQFIVMYNKRITGVLRTVAFVSGLATIRWYAPTAPGVGTLTVTSQDIITVPMPDQFFGLGFVVTLP